MTIILGIWKGSKIKNLKMWGGGGGDDDEESDEAIIKLIWWKGLQVCSQKLH